jgi:hypothetical protein
LHATASLIALLGSTSYALAVDAYASNQQPPLEARAFVRPRDRVLREVSKRPELTIQVEAVNGSFDPAGVVFRSMKMLRHRDSPGIAKIQVIHGELDRDTDRNGLTEIAATFAMSDVRALLAGAEGDVEVEVRVYGVELETAQWFETPLTLHVIWDQDRIVRFTEQP